MKADKKYLTKQLESILANGICDGEEIDLTSEKLIKIVWPYFEYAEFQLIEFKEAMKTSLDLIEYMNGLTQVPSSDQENYTNRVLNCMAEIDDKIRR